MPSGGQDALHQVRKLLIANYGPNDDDVDYLLRQFLCSV